jgi:RNA polymerase sigma-70 factor (ECF subfamily)
MNAAGAAARSAERVARDSYGRLVAWLAARSGDIAGAEDALSEAFTSALASWPKSGVPDSPDAWLLAAARRKLTDDWRRRKVRTDAWDHVALLAEEGGADEDAMPDRRLALMFACAHPAIEAGVRAPLILQTLLGFDAAAIGSAFLVSPTAMGQRLVRAKSKIRDGGIRLRDPEPEDLPARLPPVLAAVYAAFSEGWVDAAGADSRRRNLAEEGLWLGRLLVQLLPEEPETLGLLSLMLHAEARRPARRDGAGRYVPLSEQDVGLWNADLMAEAEALLFRAAPMGRMGRYQVEAAIQSAHAIRRFGQAPDWPAIVGLYGALEGITGSPVAALNRAVALAEIRGAAGGLEAMDAIDDARLQTYQPWWAARAVLLAKAGRLAEAGEAYERAIGLEADPAVRDFLSARRADLDGKT